MSRFVTPQHTYNARGHMTTDAHTDALAATQASRSSPDAADAARNAQHRHPRRRQRHLRHLWEAMGTQRRSSRRGRRVLSCYLAHPGEEVQLVLVHLRAPPGGGEMGWQSSGIAPLLRLEVSHLASHEAQLRMQLPTREETVKGRRRGNERSEGGLRGGRDTGAAGRVHRARAERSLHTCPGPSCVVLLLPGRPRWESHITCHRSTRQRPSGRLQERV